MTNEHIDPSANLAAARIRRAQARKALSTADKHLSDAIAINMEASRKIKACEEAIVKAERGQAQRLQASIAAGGRIDDAGVDAQFAEDLEQARGRHRITAAAVESMEVERDRARANLVAPEEAVRKAAIGVLLAELAVRNAKLEALEAELLRERTTALGLADAIGQRNMPAAGFAAIYRQPPEAFSDARAPWPTPMNISRAMTEARSRLEHLVEGDTPRVPAPAAARAA